MLCLEVVGRRFAMRKPTQTVFATVRLAGVLTAYTSFLLVCQLTRAAESGEVQLEVSPATIQLTPGYAADVMLVIKNPSSVAVDGIDLQWSTDTGLTITPAESRPRSVAAGGVVGWPVHLTAEEPGRAAGVVQFWLRFSRHASGAVMPAVASASLTLQEHTPLAVDKLVDGKLEETTEQLNEKHPSWLYLVVTNHAAVPVTITELKAHKPDFIVVCDPASSVDCPPKKTDAERKRLELPTVKIAIQPQILKPQSSWVFPVEMKATDKARPGKEQIVFEVGLSWKDAGQLQSGSVVVPQDVPINVFASLPS
jgi:hypothetical protein